MPTGRCGDDDGEQVHTLRNDAFWILSILPKKRFAVVKQITPRSKLSGGNTVHTNVP